MGRETKRTYSSSGKSVITTYNADGSRATVSDANGTTSFSYTSGGRLYSVTNPDGTFINYSYDNNGNVLNRNTSFGNLSYSYDNANKMESVSSGAISVDYGYDARNFLSSKTYSNGMRANFTSDAMGRFGQVTYSSSKNIELANYVYTRDAIGNILQADELTQAISYSYNANNMLVSENVTGGNTIENAFGYDAVGNRNSANGNVTSFNNRDQITTNSYDNMGRLLNDGNSSFVWGDNDVLEEVSKSGNSVYYKYDSDGFKTARFSSTDTTYYLVDHTLPHSQVIAEYGSDTTFYLYGLQREVSISERDTNFFIFDAQGSTRHLVDNNATITDSYNYSAFGELILKDGISENNYLFTGEEFDFETGLQYNRARWYSSLDGRFVSIDPYSGDRNNPLSLHRYMYAENNPLVKFDPSGEMTIASTMAAMQVYDLLAVYNMHSSSYSLGTANTNHSFSMKSNATTPTQIKLRIAVMEGHYQAIRAVDRSNINGGSFDKKSFNKYYGSPRLFLNMPFKGKRENHTIVNSSWKNILKEYESNSVVFDLSRINQKSEGNTNWALSVYSGAYPIFVYKTFFPISDIGTWGAKINHELSHIVANTLDYVPGPFGSYSYEHFSEECY